MRSLVGKASNIMILLVIIIASVFILREIEIVRAQTANESNISGYEIANISIENLTEILTINLNFTNNTQNSTEEIVINETNVSNITLNETLNETIENITINETVIPNETSNETSQENFTINETSNETQVILNFDISLNYPKKITRGEIIRVKANVINTGSSTARNVVISWKIPDGFEIFSGNDKEFCGILEPSDPCSSEIELKTDIFTTFGLNEIRVVVNYE